MGYKPPYYLTAYGLAVKNGFKGTLEEWMASLKGEKGDAGEQGPRGEKGDKGEQGVPGNDGADGHTPEKGVDYMTPSDIREIVDAVMEALPDGDSVSY